MQPTGRTVPSSARVLIADGDQRNVELCGRGHDGLQLICIPLGGNTVIAGRLVAYTTHPAVTTPEPDELVIWRYMDFTKFVSMLEDQALFFPSLFELTRVDAFEGALSTPVVQEFLNAPRGEDMSEEQARERGEHNLRVFGMARQLLYVNCWHQNDHESAAMWRLYLQSGEGIAVRSSIGRLKQAFAQVEEQVHVGAVQYIDYRVDRVPWNNGLHLALHKRRSFQHEREVRAILFGGWNVSGVKVHVSLPDLLESVYVAPNSPDWLCDLVTAVLRRYGQSIGATRSSLEDRPVY